MSKAARPETILIIEDEPAIADTVAYALETEGFLTRCVRLAAEGLAILRSEPIALIVLDVGLPDGNGLEVCKTLRGFCDAPVVFLTARGEEIDRIVGIEIGADDYVVKPFSPRELSARVKAILKRTRPAPSRHPSATHFEVDADGHAVRFHGQPLTLTRSELRILTLLLEQPGRILTRRQIMERAWDVPEMSQERAVDTHIKTLRAKLRRVAPDEVIRTHRGLGYSLTEPQS